jgi:Glycoside hydrolase family 44
VPSLVRHRDVHPAGAMMDEVRNRMIDFAARIKAVDPGALVVGPEEWGWSGYLFSGYYQQYGSADGWGFLPDRNSSTPPRAPTNVRITR